MTYRYTLTREVPLDLMTWHGAHVGAVLWIMLNPSTADDKIDDPTIRRVKGFTARLGYERLVVVNLYAWRATKPADLWTADNPIGPENDHVIHLAARSAAVQGAPIIAAWGAHAKPERVGRVLQIIREVRAMGCLSSLSVTKSGAPGHPLYLPSDSPLTPWPVR